MIEDAGADRCWSCDEPVPEQFRDTEHAAARAEMLRAMFAPPPSTTTAREREFSLGAAWCTAWVALELAHDVARGFFGWSGAAVAQAASAVVFFLLWRFRPAPAVGGRFLQRWAVGLALARSALDFHLGRQPSLMWVEPVCCTALLITVVGIGMRLDWWRMKRSSSGTA